MTETDRTILLKNEGNKHFADRRYAEAIRCYTLGIQSDPRNIDLLANRGAAFIELRCFIRALEDIKKVLTLQPYHVKGMHRMLKCLCGLGKYEEAKEFLKTKLNPTNDSAGLDKKDFIQLLVDLYALIKESATGVYDMARFLKHSKPKTFKHRSKNVAEFRGPVEIQTIEGKDRGLVATKDIKAGQVVICCKPFAISFEEDDKGELDMVSGSINTLGNKNPGREFLVNLIYEKIDFQPESRDELFNLFAGPELKWVTPIDSDSKKSVWAGAETKEDLLKRIREIVTYNSFSISRNEVYSEETSPDSSLIVRSTTTTGLWILPSYINHNCSEDNTIWKIVDDVMQVRAFKNIKKGEEILMSYMLPGLNFEKRQATIRSYKFSCNCILCYLEGRETPDIIEKQRRLILDRLQKQLETATTTDFTNLNNLIVTAIDELEGLQTCDPKLNLVDTSLTKLVDLMYPNSVTLGSFPKVLSVLDKLHFICSDSGLVKMACEVAILSLDCQFNFLHHLRMHSSMSFCIVTMKADADYAKLFRTQQQMRQDIERRIEMVQHDLIVAYGSLDIMDVIGANALDMLVVSGYSRIAFIRNSNPVNFYYLNCYCSFSL